MQDSFTGQSGRYERIVRGLYTLYSLTPSVTSAYQHANNQDVFLQISRLLSIEVTKNKAKIDGVAFYKLVKDSSTTLSKY